MERDAPSKLNAQIYAEACAWFVECRSSALDDGARREFDRWLRKSPEHLSAYLEIAAIWNEGPALDPLHLRDTEQLIAEAAEDSGNVVPLGATLAPSSASTLQPPSPNRRVHAFAASIAVVAIASALVWFHDTVRSPTYVTDVGEQRSFSLPDGSTVELNSRSKLEVRYSEEERALELLEGQAMFRVAHDSRRPFIVKSDNMRVRAVGTQFDVYKKRSGTIVTVVEGRVAILANVPAPNLDPIAIDPRSIPPPIVETSPDDPPQSGAGADIFLSAGEQAIVTHMSVQEAPDPNITGAIAWRQRQLVFKSASLAEVAEEFNRYNERQLVVRDADLYDFHISGVFSSSDPTSLIRFLRERPEVQIIETASEIQVTKRIHEEVTNP